MPRGLGQSLSHATETYSQSDGPMRLTAILLLFSLGLTGCMTAAQEAAANYGPEPAAAKIETDVRAWLGANLKDPESAKLKLGDLRKAWYQDGLIAGGKRHFGWVQVVEVNAKNGFGGSTGFERSYLFFEAGERLTVDVYDVIEVAHMGRFFR